MEYLLNHPTQSFLYATIFNVIEDFMQYYNKQMAKFTQRRKAMEAQLKSFTKVYTTFRKIYKDKMLEYNGLEKVEFCQGKYQNFIWGKTIGYKII